MTKEDLKIFVNIPTLKTERLILRKIINNDLYDVHEYGSDPLVSKHLLWSPHTDLSYTKYYLNFLHINYKKGNFYDWGIEFNGKMIGTVGFTAFDLKNNSAQIGYVLNSKYWGRGIAPEAVKQIIKFGFETLGLERIEARYMIENISSEKVCLKCGMSKDGVLRKSIIAKGCFKDIGVCSILREEYYKTV